MKYILLLRHAKSSHDDSGLKDVDRPLAPCGEKDAFGMGKFAMDIEYLPGMIISSTAKRAKQTTRLFLKGAGLDDNIVQWNEDLYYGSSRDYLKAIESCHHEPGSGFIGTNTIMLVGHNPKMEDIAGWLCGDGSVRMPTAGLVCLEEPAKRWKHIQKGQASLKWMMIPKVFKKIQQR